MKGWGGCTGGPQISRESNISGEGGGGLPVRPPASAGGVGVPLGSPILGGGGGQAKEASI